MYLYMALNFALNTHLPSYEQTADTCKNEKLIFAPLISGAGTRTVLRATLQAFLMHYLASGAYRRVNFYTQFNIW